MTPLMDELAAEYTGSVKFTQLDIATNMQTAMKYGVMGVPSVLLFKGGEPHGAGLRGLQAKPKYQALIDEAVA